MGEPICHIVLGVIAEVIFVLKDVPHIHTLVVDVRYGIFVSGILSGG